MDFIYKRKPNYYETDQMGIIHHSNYIRWFEEGRMDFLLKMGLPMDKIEDSGIQIPVVSVESKYLKTVKISNTLDIKLNISYYNGTRLNIDYEVFNENGELCNIGSSKHCFITLEGKVVNLRKTLPALHEIFLTNYK